jgi:hypothetical protein
MAVAGNTRLMLVAGVGAFVAGCWVGMGSDTTGQPFCVAATAQPGAAPGQIVAMPASGCPAGDVKVCGRYEGEADDQKFVSDKCPND